MSNSPAKNQAAQDAYTRRVAMLHDRLALLTEYVENLPAPDAETHWGQVGTASAINSELVQILISVGVLSEDEVE